MRLRNVRGAREALVESDFTVNEPSEYRGKWLELFENNNPLHVEIGTGKGRFLMTLAEQNPDINYIFYFIHTSCYLLQRQCFA